MGKVGRFIVKELREMVFPFIFFLIVFHLVLVTKLLLLNSYKVEVTEVAVATISALIAAKAILTGEALSFTHKFNHKPTDC